MQKNIMVKLGMSSPLLTLIILAYITNPIQGAYQALFPYFLRDFLNDQETPTQVTLSLCYKPENLATVLNISGISTGFAKLENSYLERIKKDVIFLVVDLECSETEQFLKEKIHPKYFGHPFRWVILANDSNPLLNISALPDSNIFVVTSEKSGFKIMQFYKIESNSPAIFETYGLWLRTAGLIVSQRERIVSKRRQNFRKKVLTASIVITNNETLNHLEDLHNKHIDSITKVCFQITKTLIAAVNGTMKYIPASTWGYKDPKTGLWNGMCGDLDSKRADIGGTGLFMTDVRIPVMEYISMTVPTKVAFVFREPPLSYVSNIYSLPFTRRVWISAGALVVVSVLVIFFAIIFQKKQDYIENREPSIESRPSEFILLGVSAMCQMGTLIPPKIMSARISTIFLLIAVLFLYTSYTANIVALLQSTTKSIQSLSDILHSQLEVGVDDTSYNHYYFETATEPVRKALYNKKVLPPKGPGFLNISDGIAHVRRGLFAFHVELGVGYKLIEESFYEHEKCNLMTIKFIQVVDTWYGVQKHSPYKEIFKIILFKIREYGLQVKENSRIYTKKPVCAANGKSFGSVRLIDCYAALVVLAIGYALAFFTFIMEKILQNCTICML